MAWISALTSFPQIAWQGTTLAATATVSEIAKEFFLHLFHYPHEHLYAIIAMSVVVLAIPAGTAFLAKFLYDKYGSKPLSCCH